MTTEFFPVPEWVSDAVFYQIFPDRFCKSSKHPHVSAFAQWGSIPTQHCYMGGDLYGIEAQIPYLKELGVTALYLTPIFVSASNHRYHTDDYYHVDPLLGGDAAFRSLLDKAHAAGIKIMLDGVFNHCGRGFMPFHHVVENGADSPYRDWFYIDSFPLYPYDESQPAGYTSWWDIRALPKLNVDFPPVRQFLLDVAVYWIKFGIDGWRLDVPNEIADHGFWRDFRIAVKRINPEAYIVGEIWDDASPWLDGTQFDAVMNYPTRTLVVDFFAKRSIGVHEFTAGIEHELQRYTPDHTRVGFNLIGSHDTERFLTLADQHVGRLKVAVLFLMTYVGVPCLYYGDEIGLVGGKDPLNRAAFDWDVQHWQSGLREWVMQCIALRQRFVALRQGQLTIIHAHASGRTVAYARTLGREILIVAINASDADTTIDILLSGLGIDDEMLMHDQLSAWSYVVTAQRVQRVKVPANGGAVLQVARR